MGARVEGSSRLGWGEGVGHVLRCCFGVWRLALADYCKGTGAARSRCCRQELRQASFLSGAEVDEAKVMFRSFRWHALPFRPLHDPCLSVVFLSGPSN